MVLHVFKSGFARGVIASLVSISLAACGSSGVDGLTDLPSGDSTASVSGDPIQDQLVDLIPEVAPAIPPQMPANEPPVVTLSWLAPVEREDGTPLSMAEIASYRVYYGVSTGNYTNEIDINDRSTMEITLRNLTTGIYYIVVTAIDEDGRESANSKEVIRSI